MHSFQFYILQGFQHSFAAISGSCKRVSEEQGAAGDAGSSPTKRLKTGHFMSQADVASHQPTHPRVTAAVETFARNHPHAAAFFNAFHQYREDPWSGPDVSTDTLVPDELFMVERQWQLLHYHENLIDWEERKGTPASIGWRNMHFSAHHHGQGKTQHSARLAASPRSCHRDDFTGEFGFQAGSVGFQIHVDRAEALAEHANTFQYDGPRSSPPKPGITGEQVEWRRQGLGELKAVHAVWKSVRTALALTGVWLLLTEVLRKTCSYRDAHTTGRTLAEELGFSLECIQKPIPNAVHMGATCCEGGRVPCILCSEAILGIPIQLSAVQDVSSAIFKASIYTTCAEVDKDFQSPTKESWARMTFEPIRVQPMIPPYMLPKYETSMGRPRAILCHALREVPELIGEGAAAEMAVRLETAELIMKSIASSSNRTLGSVFSFMTSSPHASSAFKSPSHKYIPGAKVQLKLVLDEETRRLLQKLPWAKLLAPAEVGLQLQCLWEAACGIPHPNSAGPDLIFLSGREGERVAAAFQIKYRTRADITGPVLQGEIKRTGTHASAWREAMRVRAVYLIYLIVGSHSLQLSSSLRA
ncbi:hypothetical protein WJX84_012285 [Apatococcus fuscideae]|uniref:Uncharacterized protein n=1 Tax=Apatococcus fuscideae TaxID=2026836 RepID=A0AAW1S1L9_9CHLO